MPTCTGGDIADEGDVWVVTPEGNVASVTIENLPTGAAVTIKSIPGLPADKAFYNVNVGK